MRSFDESFEKQKSFFHVLKSERSTRQTEKVIATFYTTIFILKTTFEQSKSIKKNVEENDIKEVDLEYFVPETIAVRRDKKH